MSESILSYLHRKSEPCSAVEIGLACELDHEETYTALVAMENAGHVRVVSDFTDPRRCSGVRKWELM